MRAVLAVAARERVVAVRLPLIRPCGATFPLGGRLGGSHPRQINFFAIASASPAGLRPQARVEAQPPEAALSAETEAVSGPDR